MDQMQIESKTTCNWGYTVSYPVEFTTAGYSNFTSIFIMHNSWLIVNIVIIMLWLLSASMMQYVHDEPPSKQHGYTTIA